MASRRSRLPPLFRRNNANNTTKDSHGALSGTADANHHDNDGGGFGSYDPYGGGHQQHHDLSDDLDSNPSFLDEDSHYSLPSHLQIHRHGSSTGDGRGEGGDVGFEVQDSPPRKSAGGARINRTEEYDERTLHTDVSSIRFGESASTQGYSPRTAAGGAARESRGGGAAPVAGAQLHLANDGAHMVVRSASGKREITPRQLAHDYSPPRNNKGAGGGPGRPPRMPQSGQSQAARSPGLPPRSPSRSPSSAFRKLQQNQRQWNQQQWVNQKSPDCVASRELDAAFVAFHDDGSAAGTTVYFNGGGGDDGGEGGEVETVNGFEATFPPTPPRVKRSSGTVSSAAGGGAGAKAGAGADNAASGAAAAPGANVGGGGGGGRIAPSKSSGDGSSTHCAGNLMPTNPFALPVRSGSAQKSTHHRPVVPPRHPLAAAAASPGRKNGSGSMKSKNQKDGNGTKFDLPGTKGGAAGFVDADNEDGNNVVPYELPASVVGHLSLVLPVPTSSSRQENSTDRGTGAPISPGGAATEVTEPETDVLGDDEEDEEEDDDDELEVEGAYSEILSDLGVNHGVTGTGTRVPVSPPKGGSSIRGGDASTQASSPSSRGGGSSTAATYAPATSGATAQSTTSSAQPGASTMTRVNPPTQSSSPSSSRDRLTETIRCALSLSSPVDGDPVSLIGTVKTEDEDDEELRARGPVDLDESAFVHVRRGDQLGRQRSGSPAFGVSGGDDATTPASRGGRTLERKRSSGSRRKGNSGPVDVDREGFVDAQSNLYDITLLAREHLKAQEYEEVIDIYRTLLRSHRETYGPRHHLVASTLHNLSVVHTWKGEYDEALPYCRECLRIRKDLLGADNLDVAMSLSEMGIIHYAREEFSSSIQALRESLQILCKALGYDHPHVARVLNNIACVHYETGKLIAAHATLEESLDIQRSSMGSNEDADVALLNMATTLCNIGMVSVKRRQYDAAISLLDEGLMVQESVLGDDHHVVRSTSDNLNLLVNLKNKGGETDTFARDGNLHIVDSRDVPNKKNNSALSQEKSTPKFISMVCTQPGQIETVDDESQPYKARGHFEKGGAKRLFGDGDGIPSRRIDKTHVSNRDVVTPGYIDVLNLGSLKREMTTQQRVRNAIFAGFERSSHQTTSSNYPKIPVLFSIPSVPFSSGDGTRSPLQIEGENSSVVDAEHCLEEIYTQAKEHLERNEIDEALDLFDGVLRNHRSKYGEVHHLVGTALHNKGVVQLYADNYEEARALFQEAVDVRTAALGPEHPDVSVSLVKCGMALLALEDFDNAQVIFSQVLRVRRKVLGYSHPQVAVILINIGCAHYELGGLLAAQKAFEEALEIEREECKKNPSNQEMSVKVAATLGNIGFVYVKRKEFAEAIIALEEALDIQREFYNEDHPAIDMTVENLAFAMAAANDQSKAGQAGSLLKMTEMYMDMLKCGATVR